MRNPLNIVVAGAVDSGKSTLVGGFLHETGSLHQGAKEEIEGLCRRLGRDFEFAYLLDSFEEERKGELTIDTTQAYCRNKFGKEIIFIDVPGHRELIKNMLSGASYADAAILVADISESLEDQTKIHALLLKFLGIKDIIFVLNKIDKTNFSEEAFKRAKENAGDFFRQIGIKPGYYVPLSAKLGSNLFRRCKDTPWYRGLSLFQVLQRCSNKPVGRDFRFSVQDIYNIGGQQFAVGPIISGKIAKRQIVHVLPLKRKSKIREIRSFNKYMAKAAVPEAVGLILEDMNNLERGFIISDSNEPDMSTEIRAKVFCFSGLSVDQAVNIRCLNQSVRARIRQLNRIWALDKMGCKAEGKPLSNFEFADAVIVTDNPLITERFRGSNSLGRFAIERNNEICAIGIVS